MRTWTIALFALAACADSSPSRVLVIVDAEDLVRSTTREVEVAVWGGEASPPSEDGVPLEERFVMRRVGEDAGFEWPLRILLRPRDGRDRTYRVRVRAYDAASTGPTRPTESFVAETRAVNRYARGEVRELRLWLLNDCIGQMCEQNERCVSQGLCEDLAEETLLPSMDAGVVEGDGGNDDASAPECARAADCDDENPCTDDACVDGACERTNNAASCDDGFFCTSDDVCSAGRCEGGDDPCGALTCDEGSDRCAGCTSTCPDEVGAWGECVFVDDCAVTGTQSREVRATTCTGGVCEPSGDTRIEMQTCAREDTSGQLCGDRVETSRGTCVPSSGGCGIRAGTQTVTYAQPVCAAGGCSSRTEMEMVGCTVTVPCTDGGTDGGVNDAGVDSGRDSGFDGGEECVCMTGGCAGQPCPNGGTCDGSQCVGGETSCANGSDDDLDTLTDCDDPDCSCADAGGPEICDNGVDDDGDSLADCLDSDCAGDVCTGCGGGSCLCVGSVCSVEAPPIDASVM